MQLLWKSLEIPANHHRVDQIASAERSMAKLFVLAWLAIKAAHQTADQSALSAMSALRQGPATTKSAQTHALAPAVKMLSARLSITAQFVLAFRDTLEIHSLDATLFLVSKNFLFKF